MRIKSVLIKNTILVICHRKKLFQAWTDALSLSELVLFHSLKWQLSIITKYKCFILERALVERLKAILRKLLSLFERGVWVRASCFALGRLHVYKDAFVSVHVLCAVSSTEFLGSAQEMQTLAVPSFKHVQRCSFFSIGTCQSLRSCCWPKENGGLGTGARQVQMKRNVPCAFFWRSPRFFFSVLSFQISLFNPLQHSRTFGSERGVLIVKRVFIWRNGSFKSFWFLSSNQISVLHRVYS